CNGGCRWLAGLVDLRVKRLRGFFVEVIAWALEREYQLKVGLVEIPIGGDVTLFVAIDALIEAIPPCRLRFRFLPAGQNLILAITALDGRLLRQILICRGNVRSPFIDRLLPVLRAGSRTAALILGASAPAERVGCRGRRALRLGRQRGVSIDAIIEPIEHDFCRLEPASTPNLLTLQSLVDGLAAAFELKPVRCEIS